MTDPERITGREWVFRMLRARAKSDEDALLALAFIESCNPETEWDERKTFAEWDAEAEANNDRLD